MDWFLYDRELRHERVNAAFARISRFYKLQLTREVGNFFAIELNYMVIFTKSLTQSIHENSSGVTRKQTNHVTQSQTERFAHYIFHKNVKL